VLDWLERDRHLVSCLEALLAESLGQYVRPALHLDGPMHYLTISARGVEPQEAMRIAPEPFGDRPLHRDFLSDVELGGAVMCEQRNGYDEEAKSYSEDPHDRVLHCDCLHDKRSAAGTHRAGNARSIDLMPRVLRTGFVGAPNVRASVVYN